MHATVTRPITGRELVTRIRKYTVRRVLFPLGVLAPSAYFFPKIALFYAVCGAYDVARNRGAELFNTTALFHRQRVPNVDVVSTQHSPGISCRCPMSMRASVSAGESNRPTIRTK